MQKLTAAQIKKTFVNASRTEIARMTIPAHILDAVWENREYIGWMDPKIPQRACLLVPVDDRPRGIVLRTTPTTKNSAMCSWCEDIHETSGVTMFVARKAGSAGRNGNSLGTLLHSGFDCPEFVRTPPRIIKDPHDQEVHITRRIAVLGYRAESFLRRVMGEK